MEREIEQETEQDQPEAEVGKFTAAVEERPPRQQRDAAGGQDSRPRRYGRGRRRACAMCVDRKAFVDYKDFSFLRRFLSDRGRIESRRKTGTCAKHQRSLAQAIKRARHLALLPYTAEHVRTGVTPYR